MKIYSENPEKVYVFDLFLFIWVVSWNKLLSYTSFANSFYLDVPSLAADIKEIVRGSLVREGSVIKGYNYAKGARNKKVKLIYTGSNSFMTLFQALTLLHSERPKVIQFWPFWVQ